MWSGTASFIFSLDLALATHTPSDARTAQTCAQFLRRALSGSPLGLPVRFQPSTSTARWRNTRGTRLFLARTVSNIFLCILYAYFRRRALPGSPKGLPAQFQASTSTARWETRKVRAYFEHVRFLTSFYVS
jgi:hypothetical protein